MEANICYFASKMNLIPTTLKGKNIFSKWFLCHYFIVNTSNLRESILYCANNKTDNVWRLYFRNTSQAETQAISGFTSFSDFSN